jgi:N-acetyl-gamma-glutamyl-phosphate reductase
VPIRLFIDGAAGTTGLEIRERLQGRSEFDLIVLDDAQRKDESARRDALHAADIAILCMPDEAAKEAVTLAKGSATRIIDASSAHRVADGWTYGFPELIGREKIANAQFVSNPGCYPTGFLALVAPLLCDLGRPDWNRFFGLAQEHVYMVIGISGYSGGGNALVDRFAQDPAIAYRRYAMGGGHKHLAEMQKYAGLHAAPLFLPSVVPAYRGMIVEVPLAFWNNVGNVNYCYPNFELARFYKDSPIIRFREDQPTELLLRADAEPWDGMEIFCYNWQDSDRLQTEHYRLIARFDNLGKGASGAAIQNLNIMCGLPETTGLRL